MDYAENLKVGFRVENLDLPEEDRDTPLLGRKSTCLKLCAPVAQQ